MMPAQRFAASAGSVPAVRRFVSASLADVDAEQREIALLVVSELATNAVLHSGTDFVVNVRASGGDVRIEVSDTGPGDPVMLAPPPEAPHGRGLQIVDGLASAWGVTEGPAPARKTVWVSVAAPPAG